MEKISHLLEKFFKIYKEETIYFLWMGALFFLISLDGMFLDNYADTVFLKRYGVKYLPNIFIINAVLIFVLMNYLMVYLERYSSLQILKVFIIVFGGITVIGRIAVHYKISAAYPVLYILNTQYETLLMLFFWNIANELFNTRQSKRLFPLITAAGVLGRIVGNFFTKPLPKLIGIDNILLLYVALLLVGLFMLIRFQKHMPPPSGQVTKKKRKKASIVGELKEIGPLCRRSRLFLILVIITLLPNIVIPIFNYQFNFVVDKSFHSEGGLMAFFAIFRGCFNIITFFLLLLTGRFYAYFGLGLSLMFHPFNYALVFISLFFFFNIYSAIYGRMSTNILRATLNNPARSVLLSLFPSDIRLKARPILRGTIVRIGSVLGSLYLIILKGMVSPAHLAVFGFICSAVWLLTNIYMKKHYASILLEVLTEKRVDLQELPEAEMKLLLKDNTFIKGLLDGLSRETGPDCLWYAGLLRQAEYPELSRIILAILPAKEAAVQRNLLTMATAVDESALPKRFDELRNELDPSAQPDLIRAMATWASLPGMGERFYQLAQTSPPELAVEAWAGVYRRPDHREQAWEALNGFLSTSDDDLLAQAALAAGKTGDSRFKDRLVYLAGQAENDQVRAAAITGLTHLVDGNFEDILLAGLGDTSARVRLASMQGLEINSDVRLRTCLRQLADPEIELRQAAIEKALESEFVTTNRLLQNLDTPFHEVKEGILTILERQNEGKTNLEQADDDEIEAVGSRQSTSFDLNQYIQRELNTAYINLIVKNKLAGFDSPWAALLTKKMDEANYESIYTIIKLLEIQLQDEDMRVVLKSILEGTSWDRSNAVELLENKLHPSLKRVLVPLVDEVPMVERMRVASKYLNLADFVNKDIKELVQMLGRRPDPVLRMCLLQFLAHHFPGPDVAELALSLQKSRHRPLQETATQIYGRLTGAAPASDGGTPMLPIMDKILLLKKVKIFSGLKVNELAAIASVVTEKEFEPDAVVVKEGEAGTTLYLITEGNVSVIKNMGQPSEVILDKLIENDYFGEMALFDSKPRSASIKTLGPTKMLTLNKLEFEEIVKEYGKIALAFCQVFGERLRKLHDKINAVVA
ncbi:MAG: cyclic nucleotide-binding domain-containing protein [Deltaproteobacteria bacterium]|nr:cyclic nucleotide-binding domain-containing protein [Deltaproteobacteria bacterium]